MTTITTVERKAVLDLINVSIEVHGRAIGIKYDPKTVAAMLERLKSRIDQLDHWPVDPYMDKES